VSAGDLVPDPAEEIAKRQRLVFCAATAVLAFPTEPVPSAYIPVAIFGLLAAAFPAVTLLLFKLIRPASTSLGAKLKPYECGIPAEGDARGRYSVRFYIVAILFVIFDVETIFLFPWAVNFAHATKTGTAGTDYLAPLAMIFSMFTFLGILVIGYVWLYRKRALDWV
jgi:NADH-quinone oxidoreductase subunit A